MPMDRRVLLSVIAGVLVIPEMARAMVDARPLPRRLQLINPHTGERFEGFYRNENGPVASAMTELSAFLRDFHSGTAIAIDVGVVDFLAAIMDAIGVKTAVILSGYRTPETNAMLAQTTFGVAENSQHLYGRALDVYFPQRLADAMLAARAMQRGGVGWYPNSGFIHVDTGPVRNWDLDGAGLGSLLLGDRRVHFKDDMQQNSAILPEIRRSGQILPQVQASGRIKAELMHSGRVLPLKPDIR